MPAPLLLAMLPSLVGTGIGMAQNRGLKKDLQGKLAEVTDKYETQLGTIRDMQIEVPQAVRDFADSQIQAGQAIGKKAEDRVDESVARMYAALGDNPRIMQSAGLRGLETALEASEQADVQATNMKLRGEGQLAQAESDAYMKNFQKDLALEQLLMQRNMASADALQQGIYGADAAMTQGIMSAGNMLSTALMQPEPGDYITNNYAAPQTVEKGGIVEMDNFKTGGEFNHATNEKLMVDRDSGEVEAALTGDEVVVLNPDQQEGGKKAYKLLASYVSKNPDAPAEIKEAMQAIEFYTGENFA